MAAPGGILHKVQLHFEKCIQFTAVSALSFSPVFFSPLLVAKKKKNSRNIFASPPPLASVFMLGGVGGVLGTEESRFIFTEKSETRTQTCEFE